MSVIFETHAHYEDEAFDEDRDELIKSLPESGIGYVVNVGSSIATCHRTVELIKYYDYMYGALGIHPGEIHRPFMDMPMMVVFLDKVDFGSRQSRM